MRTRLFILGVMCAVTVNAQWSPRPSNTTHYLRDLFFPTPDLGFAVGDSGTIVRTQDAGENWTVVHDDPSLELRGVHFPTPTTGFAAGGSWSSGVILKTIDGGDSWAPCFTAAMQYFGSVHFLDTLLGYAGGSGYVLRTVDGGANWDTIPGMVTGALFNSISFPSPQTGYFVGGTSVLDVLYRTTDGGLSSEPITNGFQVIKEACQFLNDTAGFMGGWYGAMLEKTTDGGTTWNSIWPFGDGVWDLHFADEDHGFAVGWGGGWGSIYATQNGGADWSYQYQDPTYLLEALHMVDALTGFAAGSEGLILKTTNGGVSIHGPAAVDHAMRVHPNPASDAIAILAQGATPGGATMLELIDGLGRSVARAAVVVRDGRAVWTIPPSIAAGSYTLVLLSDQQVLGSAPIHVCR